MHIRIRFRSDEGLVLPIQHNHILQGFIYRSIDERLATFLHDCGYLHEGRPFKLFAFSRIQGPFNIDRVQQTIDFGNEFSFCIASPLNFFCQSLCEGLLKQGQLRLGQATIYAVEAEVSEPQVTSEDVLVVTQSPVCVYSTLLRPNGQKYTCYFQPGEKDFSALIASNLGKKYSLIYGQDHPAANVDVSSRSPKMTIVNYKDFIVKGYTGVFRLQGPAELIQVALDAGLGSKNSQGFGFVELFQRR